MSLVRSGGLVSSASDFETIEQDRRFSIVEQDAWPFSAGDHGNGGLNEAIHQHGRRFTRDELLVRATGRKLDPAPYLAYLRGKVVDVYRVNPAS